MKNLTTFMPVATLLCALLVSGCFTTSIQTGVEPIGVEQSDRQFFLIGGLVDLSDPAGEDCEHGLAWAESEMAVIDVLIAIGLGIAGTAAGGFACEGIDDEAQQASCVSGFSSFASFFFGTRTVHYQCAAPG